MRMENLLPEGDQLRVIRNRRTHEPDFFRGARSLAGRLLKKRPAAHAMGKIRVTTRAEAASSPATPAEFDQEHPGELCVGRNQRRNRESLIQVF